MTTHTQFEQALGRSLAPRRFTSRHLYPMGYYSYLFNTSERQVSMSTFDHIGLIQNINNNLAALRKA